jgi:hypothetical protein
MKHSVLKIQGNILGCRKILILGDLDLPHPPHMSYSLPHSSSIKFCVQVPAHHSLSTCTADGGPPSLLAMHNLELPLLDEDH